METDVHHQHHTLCHDVKEYMHSFRVTRFEFVKKRTLRRGGRVWGPACYTLAYPAFSPATKCPLFHKLKSGHPIITRLDIDARFTSSFFVRVKEHLSARVK